MNEKTMSRLTQTNYYSWIPWFRALVKNIVDGDEDELVAKAKQVNWASSTKSKPALLMFGDEGIDPFSFFYFLASHNASSSENRRATFHSVHDVLNYRMKCLTFVQQETDIIRHLNSALTRLFHNGETFNRKNFMETISSSSDVMKFLWKRNAFLKPFR